MTPQLKHYRRLAQQNLLLGLTVKGTARRRRPNAALTAGKLAERRERGLAAWNRRVQRLRDQGLTTRGQPRIYPVRRGDALLLGKEIDAVAMAVAAVFHDVPPVAQARLLTLAHSLAAIRRQVQ